MKTARTSQCGACSQRRSSRATTCEACLRRRARFSQTAKSSPSIRTRSASKAFSIGQAPPGVEGFQYSPRDGVGVWFKPLEGGDWAMAVLNRNTSARRFTFDWKAEKAADTFSKRDARLGFVNYSLRDLWTGRSAGDTRKALSTEIPAHDVLMLRLRKI